LRHASDEEPYRKYLRHELMSALALMGEGAVALDGHAEPDLIVYLVAAHHGRIRIGIRTMPDERSPKDDTMLALGVLDGDVLPSVVYHDGEIPASVLNLGVMMLGERDGVASWSDRALRLRDRGDIGPFRLGFAEALVRIADWQASARHDSDQGRSE
jgi:CRISPR-associated endonuclease/helicase Cas3